MPVGPPGPFAGATTAFPGPNRRNSPPDRLPVGYFEGTGLSGGPETASEALHRRESAQPFFRWFSGAGFP